MVFLDRVQAAPETPAVVADGQSKPTAVIEHGRGDRRRTGMLKSIVDRFGPNAGQLLLGFGSQVSGLTRDPNLQPRLRTPHVDLARRREGFGELAGSRTGMPYLDDPLPRLNDDAHSLGGNPVNLALLPRRYLRVDRPGLQTKHQRLDSLQQGVVEVARNALSLGAPGLHAPSQSLLDMSDTRQVSQPHRYEKDQNHGEFERQGLEERSAYREAQLGGILA